MATTPEVPCPTPTIHLNGTAQKVLLEDNSRVRMALRKALKELEQAAPHARDYVNRLEDLQEAMRIHKARVTVIDGMIRALDMEGYDIAQAGA